MVKELLRDNTTFNDAKIQDLSNLVVSKFNKQLSLGSFDKFDSLVSLKPTKETKPIIDYIDEYLLENCSLSEYFRNMFVAYTALPQDMREQIIFKTQYLALTDAIKQGKNVYITFRSKTASGMEISPYVMSRSKEEMHIYLLYSRLGRCASVKLHRIESVTVLDNKYVFSNKEKRLFEKMLTYGVQFFYNFDEAEVKVRLNKKGQKLFRKIYVHRPIPDSVDGDIYTFKCSHTQLLQYFSRFGGDVEIISPRELNKLIYDFHNSFVENNKHTIDV